MTTLEYLLTAYNGLLTGLFFSTYFNLRRQIKSVEFRLNTKVENILINPPLDEEQSEYKKKLDQIWQLAMEQQVKTFNVKLENEFKKAEEKIDFEKVKYKKTISQKRKIARKKLPDIPDGSSWRDINEC